MTVWTRTRRALGLPTGGGSAISEAGEVVTHTEAGAAMPATATVAQEVARIRSIDAWHRSLGWQGFGYHATVTLAGRAYQGRTGTGAHTSGRNRLPGIVVLGHGDRTPMSQAAIDAHRDVQRHWIKTGVVTDRPHVSGHRDHPGVTKTCPGNRIYPQLPELRGVTLDPDPEDDPMATLDQDDVDRIAEAVADKLGWHDPARSQPRSYQADASRIRTTIRAIARTVGVPDDQIDA